MLKLLDAEEEVLVGVTGRHVGGPGQALVHGDVYQAASVHRALTRPIEDFLYDGAALLTFDAAPFDQAIDDLLYLLAPRGCGSYVQEDQPL